MPQIGGVARTTAVFLFAGAVSTVDLNLMRLPLAGCYRALLLVVTADSGTVVDPGLFPAGGTFCHARPQQPRQRTFVGGDRVFHVRHLQSTTVQNNCVGLEVSGKWAIMTENTKNSLEFCVRTIFDISVIRVCAKK